MSMKYLLAAVLLLFASQVAAQDRHVVAGRTIKAATQSGLPGVHVVLTATADSTRRYAALSDGEGNFEIRIPGRGEYLLRASFVGFKTLERRVTINREREDLGALIIETDIVTLDELVVQDVQERVIMRGDTTVFNADAYKVNPDASAEELVAKMPGVSVQDGEVQAQGEAVRRVTVDGREFFGDDASAALRNLPADIIQSIEVFDAQSEQARFTGFNDGNTEKTINVVTREEMSNGRFGKVFGGYGAEERYLAGATINIFDGDRRITLTGVANNVNQQNFAFQDLLEDSGGGDRGGGSRSRGGRGRPAGLNTTSSAGINYTDQPVKGLKVNGSYAFGRTGNTNEALLDRQFFLSGDRSQFYSETQTSARLNYNHRLNLRLEYDIDENNSLMFTPRVSFQDNSSEGFLEGTNVLSSGAMLSRTLNDNMTENFGYSSSADLRYRRRFARKGRSISASVGVGLNDSRSDGARLAETRFFEGEETEDPFRDEVSDNKTARRSLELDLNYTEPVGRNGQLRLRYNPEASENVADRLTFARDLQTGEYTLLVPTYSSLFDNTVFAQRAGAAYQARWEDKLRIELELDYRSERLRSDQTYPVAFEVDRTFHSLLPEAMIAFELGDNRDLRFYYRTGTNTPSATQLRDVLDNANPLFLTSGNPHLRPGYSHSVSTRYRQGDRRAGSMLFGFASVTMESNPLGRASLLAERDTLLAQGALLQKGSQYSYPVNLEDGRLSARSYVVHGTPFPLIKSNVNLNAGLAYSRASGLINGRVNRADTYGLSSGLTVGSNISERLDFTLSYSADYTIASNTIIARLDENYMRHRSGVRFVWLPAGGLVLETDVNYRAYTGLDENLYPGAAILNAGLGYKFLRRNAAEVKFILGDLLNQETGTNRSITEMYVEDSRTQVLGRYVLLTMSYRVRNFNM